MKHLRNGFPVGFWLHVKHLLSDSDSFLGTVDVYDCVSSVRQRAVVRRLLINFALHAEETVAVDRCLYLRTFRSTNNIKYLNAEKGF